MKRNVLIVMCAGLFVVLLDVTIVNVALPSIATGRHAGLADLQWVVDGYQIALAGLLLTGGTLGDRFGHRRVVLAGFALFGLASAGCALAPGVGALVAARAVQGVGAALLLPGTLAVITRIFPGDQERARAIGVWAAVGSAALPAGPLLGGVLIQAFGWPSIFAINVPLILIIFVAVLRAAPADEPERRPIDLPGTMTGAGTLLVLTYAVIQAGRDGPDWRLFAVAAALLAAFVVIESRREAPMLPLGLLRRPSIAVGTIGSATMNFGINGMMLLITLYLQGVLRLSPMTAGAALLPLFVPLALLSAPFGRLAGRYGPRPVMVAGLLTLAAGMGLLLLVRPAAPYLVLLPALAVIGLGAALLTPSVVALAMSDPPPGREGLVSAINNTARQAGGAIGVAAFGAMAGAPGGPRFIGGLHGAAVVAGAAYLGVTALTLTLGLTTRHRPTTLV
ncbi:MFS transporter [Nonomuraea aurantiaca]|uniref:MFS transporter n=1 Tax=Nonomuraea aurantiaca TaxID=2878562 RepID=UPI001CD991EB|nr:MFS transporter [Nonomuraea aurantiaca]MCA2223738.1 MFS transporter [Nonomuraea aurantiaca]